MKTTVLSVLFGLLTITSARKNVLFFAVDDLRPELTCFEGPDFPSPVHPPMHTPNIDALAARSLVLKRAFVQQAVCSPSRTSLLTGRRPDTTHIYDLVHYFRKLGGNFTTIPEFFKMNGYISAGMGKIFHPGPASGGDDPISWSLPYFHATKYGWENKEKSWDAIPDEKLTDKPLVDYQIAQQADKTLKMFAEGGEHEGTPFFIAVGFHRPHLPFVFPESFLKYYPDDNIRLPPNPYAPVNMPEVAWSSYGELRNYGDQSKLNASGMINTTLPINDVRALRRGYYSAVSWTDSLVGYVMQQLEKYGFGNNTIVSFWGDHGWQLGEHGEWCKHTNFELATHAPMMVRVPGKTDSGMVTEKLTEFVDLFPTLVDAAELEPIPLCPENSSEIALCREGESLMSLIENPSAPWKDAAFSQYPRDQNGVKIMGYTIRTGRFRYTEWPKFNYAPDYQPEWGELYGLELYDHQFDPQENINRALEPTFAQIRQILSKKLHAGWRAALPGQ
ncbi:iduronate 2-sulfatase-like [Mercenaria mercenaria]|uniref:iduronate 2-sulfatase-like n=1 Tax=Mercenaria mercenaria TaxID=6596 RepID=UPI00234F2F28|nr:iduronate 2-sulfatase-like [Mercenaria mercenaria]